MAVSPAEAKAYTLYQISALGGMCQAQGMKLQHVKPPRALYNMAAKDYELSLAICEAIKEYDPELIVMGSPERDDPRGERLRIKGGQRSVRRPRI